MVDDVTTPREELGNEANVAVLAPPMANQIGEVCGDLLTTPQGDQRAVIHIAISESVEQILANWERWADNDLPAHLTIIRVADQMALSPSGSHDSPDGAASLSVESISSPGDLTGLGMRFSEEIGDVDDRSDHITVCFNDLTTLLQYTDLQTVFRFLHVITGQVRTADARAHYHLNPLAHDDQTLNTLLQLFDAAIEFDDTGDLTVRR